MDRGCIFIPFCNLVIGNNFITVKGFPGGSGGKDSACNRGDVGLIPGLGRFPWRKEWLRTLIFLPGESHAKRSLASYSPLGCNELDTTE